MAGALDPASSRVFAMNTTASAQYAPTVEPDAGATPDPVDAGVGMGAQVSLHTTLGLPGPAAVDDPMSWLLVRPQYVAAWSASTRTPRWVSWELSAAWLGAATRATSFHGDPLLPGQVEQARDDDYRNSGFDRGHLCPSADRTASDADNDATFFLTNVVPQTHASNAGPWESMESEARALAVAGKQLIIVAGPIFAASPQHIGAGVAVPSAMFKVMVLFDGAPGVSSVTASTTVYAAVVPNSLVAAGPWRAYQTTVREVERQAGLDLLSDVPLAVQDQLETRLDH
jgi:endonuclease G